MLRIVFSPIFGSYLFILLCAVGFCAIFWFSQPQNSRLPHYGQRILLALRSIALLLLLFAMLRPALVHTVSLPLASVVNILLDQTQSMTRNDEIGGKSRFTAAIESLQSATPQLRRLQLQTETQAFAFDNALTQLDLTAGTFTNLPDIPKGTETPLGFTLDAIRERSAGKRVLATIILTDGAQRTRPSRDILPQDAAGRMRDAGIPLYAVPLGQAGLDSNVRDIAVESIQANNRVYAKNNLLVTGTLRVNGFNDQSIPLQLLFENASGNMEVVARATVPISQEGQNVPFRLTYAPSIAGLFKYTVRVIPQEKEMTDRNNEQSGFVQVMKGGLRVLYIQGSSNFEQRQLRQSINTSPDMNLQNVRISKPGDLARIFQNNIPAYNVYILDDIISTKFTQDEMQTLVSHIREDSGLIMLGGLHAYSGGNYFNTPLAAVSPIVIRRAEPQSKDTPPRSDIHWSSQQPIPLLLTEQGQRHYVMQFDTDPQKNAGRWAALPPLLGANRFERLKPGAMPLAVGPNRQLLLASHMFGNGRVLAFAGDSTYRWTLAGKGEEHKTFWRQVILWLAKMENGGNGSCWITVENNRLFPGDSATFQIFLQTESGEKIQNFPATVKVLKPNNAAETVPLVLENGIPTGSFRSTEFSGDYTIQAEASHNGETFQASARFLVQDKNLELDNPIAFPKLLSDISETTGGKSILPEQLGELIKELIQQSGELVEKRESKQSLFDTWYLLVSFILVMATEWFLRKYWGLV